MQERTEERNKKNKEEKELKEKIRTEDGKKRRKE